MSRSSRVRRAVVPVLLAIVLGLAGCGSDERASSSVDDDGNAGSGSTANEVSAAGLAFEAPDGWRSLDPDDAEIPEAEKANLAEGLGLTPQQLDQTIGGVDLFLVDGDGPQDGFLSNINVLAQQGVLPDDAALESQFAALGAEVLEVSHSATGAGDAAVVEYTLSVADRTIEGVSYLVDLGEKIVTVTVSTPDRVETDEIGDTVGDTLTASS